MNERQRQILTDVAEGRLRPEEAATLLDERTGPAEEPPTSEPGLRRVRLVGTFRLATVAGDPAVREAVADGPHSARREGDTLILRSDLDEDEWPGFTFGGVHRPWWSWTGAEPGRTARWPRPLAVRMHPDLPLDVELTAGTLRVERLRGPLRIEVSAGSARLDDVRGPLDVSVSAGSVRVAGVLERGASRIRCEAGSVHVDLEPGSSVRVRARAELGRVALPGERDATSWMIGAGGREVTVGAGAATLDVEAAMGSVVVSAER
jgi:hypothetical protein